MSASIGHVSRRPAPGLAVLLPEPLPRPHHRRVVEVDVRLAHRAQVMAALEVEPRGIVRSRGRAKPRATNYGLKCRLHPDEDTFASGTAAYETIDHWIDTIGLVLLVTGFVTYPVLVLIHELGHATGCHSPRRQADRVAGGPVIRPSFHHRFKRLRSSLAPDHLRRRLPRQQRTSHRRGDAAGAQRRHTRNDRVRSCLCRLRGDPRRQRRSPVLPRRCWFPRLHLRDAVESRLPQGRVWRPHRWWAAADPGEASAGRSTPTALSAAAGHS